MKRSHDRRETGGSALTWAALPLLWLALAGCGGDSPINVDGSPACTYTFECATGMVCHEGGCRDAAELAPGRDAGPTGTDAGTGEDGGVLPPDAGSGDAGTSLDAGVDGGGSTRVTFGSGSYRTCRDDLECAVFGGNCLVELTLSRPEQDGRDRVKLSDLDPAFAVGEGVCTLPCTNDPRICDSITLDGPGGESAPFACQVVYAGSSPYPAVPPAFPFDSQLDPVALARGVPFASVCRPPFDRAANHSESFCRPCLDASQCSDGDACFMERGQALPPSGSCVEACSSADDCAFGFTCAAISAGGPTHCLPLEGTCGRCRDLDGDQRGVGRCGPLTEPYTDIDCDDTNPIAYYDAAFLKHPFPEFCGEFDLNCNGRSDTAEQLGSESHCASCGDVCIGRVGELANSSRACVQRAGAFECVAACEPGYADCDGQVSNGCEQQLGPNQLWAADHDGDGRGSPTEFRYVCDGQVPTGWVQNRVDCNDSSATVYGSSGALAAAPELCDGIDNDCNGIQDDPGRISGEGSACDTGFDGVCSTGSSVCNAAGSTQPGFTCKPNVDVQQQSQAIEHCDGLDNDCDGRVDDGADYYVDQGVVNPGGPGALAPCSVPGGLGICATGTRACQAATVPLPGGGTAPTASWACVATTPEPTDAIDAQGIDTNCDGSDGDLSQAVFVRPVAGGGLLDGKDGNDGTAQRPVATLKRALTLACAGGAPCRDIYLEARSFSTNEALQVPLFAVSSSEAQVRLYGGFAPTVSCDASACQLVWKRGTGRSTLVREAPARGGNAASPYGPGYAAIEGGAGTGALSLRLDQVDVEVHAPDPSVFLKDGESAPAQQGVLCPASGCSLLSFRNSRITVDAAMNGGDGVAGTSVAPANLNGGNGCSPNDNCTGVGFANGQWMEYPSNYWDYWYNDALAGKAVANCPDSQRNNGGTSGAIRYSQGSGNRGYDFDGQWGGGAGGQGGVCWSSRDTDANPQPTWRLPGRGWNGSAGSGAWISGTPSFSLRTTGGQLVPTWNASVQGAAYGRTGGGGGGGGGCIDHGDYFSCPCGQERGGGGGAGGCGGFAGGNGGLGGHTIGLVLVAPPAPATLQLHLDETGTFQVVVGRAGNGGKGGKGGDGSGGGYGGLAPGRNGYLNGGHGGDGGGGGGGGGGFGGVSIGVLRHCTRAGGTEADGCGIQVPPRLLAAPGDFVTPGAGGVGGALGVGGAGGKKAPDVERADNTVPNRGSDGIAGRDGFSATLSFTR